MSKKLDKTRITCVENGFSRIARRCGFLSPALLAGHWDSVGLKGSNQRGSTLMSLIARTLHLFILYILNFPLMHIQFGSFIVIGGYSKNARGHLAARMPAVGMPAFVGAINARLSAAKISFKFLHSASEFCRPPAKTAICRAKSGRGWLEMRTSWGRGWGRRIESRMG